MTFVYKMQVFLLTISKTTKFRIYTWMWLSMDLDALKFTVKLIEHKYCATEIVSCYG